MGGGDVQRGPVLILNGGSSSGKTTLARTLQSALPEPWLLLGIDLFTWTLPPDLVNGPGGLSIRNGVITRGEIFMSLYAGYRNAVATLARSGVSVLLDDLTLDGLVDQQRWDESLRGLDVCWIGVRCAPEVAAEREARRGSRPPGIAAVQADSVHRGVRYDLEVDTGALDPGAAMNTIAEAMARRWSISGLSLSGHGSTFPRPSAWTSEGARRSPPWEP